MNVLGISGSERDAAAAVARGGRIVAAASEEIFARVTGIGYSATGGYPLRAIQACLDRANVSLDAIDRVVVVDDARADGTAGPASDADEVAWGPDLESIACTLRSRASERIMPVDADAQQLRAATGDDLVVFVAGGDSDGILSIEHRGGRSAPARRIAGSAELFCAMKRVAVALHGRPVHRPLAAIERIAASGYGDADAATATAFHLASGGGIVVDENRLAEVLALVRADDGDRSGAYRLERVRQSVAAGFCDRLESVLTELVAHDLARTGLARAGLAGNLFQSSRLTGAVARAFDDRIVVAPVPEPAGRAIGAAIAGNGAAVERLGTLALGPEFDEEQIKIVLDNCRLEYLYEPDWVSLLARVSRILTQGLVVAWFQGPAAFGTRPVGTRSILCDPSNKYARDNINKFLRHGASEEPLGVSMTLAAAGECCEAPLPSQALANVDRVVKPEWRDRLRATVDHRGHAPVQTITSELAPRLADLLELHRGLTSVPGLVNVPLSAHGEPTAAGPRDAVRLMFSSAVDALVIGRFLLMKDHWLLRSAART
ncbi:MAG: carbamoyltransferase C-terminal domain-containing protein [Vicinamibacterales bacterium]